MRSVTAFLSILLSQFSLAGECKPVIPRRCAEPPRKQDRLKPQYNFPSISLAEARGMDDPNDDPIHMLGMPGFVSYHEIQVFHLYVEQYSGGYVGIHMSHGKSWRFDYGAYVLYGVAEERGYRIVDWSAVRANG
jgi:hypothetical protein